MSPGRQSVRVQWVRELAVVIAASRTCPGCAVIHVSTLASEKRKVAHHEPDKEWPKRLQVCARLPHNPNIRSKDLGCP